MYPECDQLSPAGSLLPLLSLSELPGQNHFPYQSWGQVGKISKRWPGRPGTASSEGSSHPPENVRCCHCGEAGVHREQAGCRLEGSSLEAAGPPAALPGVRYGCNLEPVPIADNDQQKQCHCSSPNWIDPRRARRGVWWSPGMPRIGLDWPPLSRSGRALFIFLTSVTSSVQMRRRQEEAERERASGRKRTSWKVP